MKRSQILKATLLASALATQGCGDQSTPGALAADKSQTAKEALVSGSNDFAMRLFQAVSTEQKQENAFISPFSVSSALAMTYAGARNATAAQMAEVLGLDSDPEVVGRGYGDLTQELSATKDEKGYELAIANRTWIQESYPVLPSFLTLTKDYFGAEATSVDFRGDTENTRVTINKWIESKTNERIKDLIPQGALTSATKLVLTNAVYFLAEWAQIFPEAYEGKFYPAAGGEASAQLMTRTGGFKYLANKTYQAVEIPYAGKVINKEFNQRDAGDASMVVVLPRPGVNLDKLVAGMNGQAATRLFAELDQAGGENVNVTLPKWKVEATYNEMGETLKVLGMTDAFDDERADFTGITEDAKKVGLHISKVIHKTFINVYEEGTEATGATAVIMAERTSSIPEQPTIFRADRPFLYFIRSNTTGSILFAGTLYQPAN